MRKKNKKIKKQIQRSFDKKVFSTTHHLLCKSRGGQTVKGNLKKIDPELHRAWHFLFQNMSCLEIWTMLFREQFQFSTIDTVADKQWQAWKKVFGCTVAPKEAAQIVRDKWWPEEGLPAHDGKPPIIPKKGGGDGN